VPDSRAAAAVVRVAGFGLPGSDRSTVQVPKEDWSSFLTTLDTQRLTGLAVAAAGAGELSLSGEQWDELLQRHRDSMLWALTVERKLLSLAARFEDAGIDVVALKGSTVAHTAYPDPSWRPFGDLDLLVRTSDWRRACAVLAGLGFDRRLPEPRSGFDERFGKAAVHANGDGVEIDLHRTLVLGPYGLWMDPEELFGRTTTLRLGGLEVRRLDDTALLVHACMHASLGWNPPLLMPLRDVAQVATFGHVDWGEFAELAKRWRLRAVVQHALQTSAVTLGADLPEQAGEIVRSEPSRKERRILDVYVTDRRFRGGTATATLRAIPGIRAKAAYVRALMLPSREFLDRRTAGHGSYWRRWLVPMRWMDRRGRSG
jgi:hypothetical protein